MKIRAALPCVGIALASLSSMQGSIARDGSDHNLPESPIYGVGIPDRYRQWELIAPALESEPLNELRAVLGNQTAIAAYRAGNVPFPEGTILVKLAWQWMQSAEFPPASVPGTATTVQVMVKDSAKYGATGGWGFGRFIDGKPVDEAQHRTCFACHEARVKAHDFVFTRYAP